MANLTITNTFAATTTIASAQVNTNYTDIKTWLNNRDNASDYWLNMKVSGTASNPAEIKSSAADCELDIDCTGANGTPRYSLKRSGTTYFTWGVDGAASNLFKFGTTALTTHVAFQVPTAGVQVQFASLSGSSSPAISFIGDATTGFDGSGSSSGTTTYYAAGTAKLQFTTQGILAPDGTVSAPGISNLTDANWGISRTASHQMTLASNGVSGAYFQLNANGDILTSQLAPLATNATGGFFHLPTVAGTPSGTPATYTGQRAVLFDTTASKLWIYNGTWKSVALT